MLKRIRHNWPAKLGSLLAAVVVWYLLRQAIRPQASSGPAPPTSTAAPAPGGGRSP